MGNRIVAGLALALAVLSGAPDACRAQAQDIRAYCARAGNDNSLRPLQADLVAAARRLFELGPDMSKEMVLAGTSMRCMNGAAWLCNVGANLACGKANASRKSPGATAFCRQNPNSIGVPMSATGHDTIYSFRCVGSEAKVDQQFGRVDGRGFMADNWKQLP